MAVLMINLVSAVTLSNDDYAVEAVLNKPGTIYYSHNIDNIENLIIYNNKYTSLSQYSQEIAAIFNQESSLTSGGSSGLSVRLQLPTKISEVEISFINFAALINNQEAFNLREDFYLGWKITCTNKKCNLDNQGTGVIITQISKNEYNILIESSKELVSSGKRCFKRNNNELCLTNQLEKELSLVFEHIGFVSSFDKLLASYNIITLGSEMTSSLIPDTDLRPDWQEAMRQELVNLKRKNIISIPDKEIEEIAALTKQGNAGKNKRIIFNADLESYSYYYEIILPVLTQEINSEPFSLPKIKPANWLNNPYYFIPLIATIALIFVFIILATIARIIGKKKKQKRLHPTGLLSEG